MRNSNGHRAIEHDDAAAGVAVRRLAIGTRFRPYREQQDEAQNSNLLRQLAGVDRYVGFNCYRRYSVAVTQQWRDRLLALQEELKSVAATGDESAAVVELDQTKVGRLSRMDALQAQAMAKASSNRRKAMLVKISAALRRIDDGEYGRCRECDVEINPKRLEFDPTTIYCIECASKREAS